MMLHNNKQQRCIDCACCDAENMKCYPNDDDCESEYDLSEADLTTADYCDFFKQK